jgi:hypothetical protein
MQNRGIKTINIHVGGRLSALAMSDIFGNTVLMPFLEAQMTGIVRINMCGVVEL